MPTKPKFDPNKPFKVVSAPQATGKPKFDPSKPFREVPEELEREVGSEDAEGPQEEPGLLSRAMSAYDSYMGAPLLAGISAAQKGENPFKAYGKQFGADPSTAPTGESIAAKTGLSTERKKGRSAKDLAEFDRTHNPNLYQAKMASGGYQDEEFWSPAEMAGTGIELAADPLNLIPLVGELKPLAKAGTRALKGVDAAKGALAKGLATGAEKAALNATGATAVQASKFEKDAGRQLLDRGIVRFGDNQAKIAKRAGKAVDAANAEIDSALKSLDAQGVTVDANTVYEVIRGKIKELSGDPSQADIVRQLEQELENVIKASDATGSTKMTTSAAEKTKRGYNRKAKNWMDPEKGQAGKEMYQAYRGAVEDAATAADPALATQFKEGKETYGLLAPIEEAAERRALTTRQSPLGGLLDVASWGAGAATGNPVKAVAAPVARRIISPRLASSGAASLDAASKLVKGIPELAELEKKDPVVFNAILKLIAEKQGNPSGLLKVSGDE